MLFKGIIVQIIKDEHDYLDHWIKFHTKLGFDFLLVEDVNSQPHKEICDKYNNVTLIEIFDFLSENRINDAFNGKYRQTLVIEEFLDRYINGMYNKYNFLVFIDPDEYLHQNDCYEIQDTYYRLYNDKCMFYRFAWQNMTTNDYNVLFDEHPNLEIPVYNRFRVKANLLRQPKMLVNLKFANELITKTFYDRSINEHGTCLPHYFGDTEYRDLVSKFSTDFVIYHYSTNSITEFIKRLTVKGELTKAGFNRNIKYFIKNNMQYKNEIIDYCIKNNISLELTGKPNTIIPNKNNI